MTRTQRILGLLRDHESRNVTFLAPDGSWPVVWERARGVHVWDAEGRKYLDLTAAFGVAAAGHANPRVVRAGQRQMTTLLHAMGDVHPHALKAQLARELSRLTFERWSGGEFKVQGRQFKNLVAADVRRLKLQRNQSLLTSAATLLKEIQSSKFKVPRGRAKTIFCNSGFEAVEAALKTALLATGRRGVIAFEGAYHGVGYGALNATHRDFFRGPFRAQLGQFGHFVPFPRHGEARPELAEIEEALRRVFRRQAIGAVLVEPAQGRGGINVPPAEFLPMLRRLCDEFGALLVLDEIFTGLGRTGKWFACEHTQTAPDLICLGKALTGGFPLSACAGRADLMDAAWPASSGEAIHTSTFLGHPVGCAMALAQIAEIRSQRLVERSRRLGEVLLSELSVVAKSEAAVGSCRGLGLMAGIELLKPDGTPATDLALRVVKEMLRRGCILLPEGAHGNVISFTPPLTITERELTGAVAALGEVLTVHSP
ncbi:MAG: aspartate aminotransferase family protein [Verrucomicrobia bacterium]|nr:aspartate aminotransferase family protein [Verrucomicrobiota bacterium]